ncbi:hypothetical protein [Anatilimnocola floriformis]|uniref:hypothetical protein n=1 Tax=Anatilimnocola floriformis TaxID=2948575 RepID=UPI0020C49EC1|nr:hypothetical protein [Anatilimnocola floriformis]
MSYPQQSGSYQNPYPQPNQPPMPHGGPGFPDQNPPQPASKSGCLWGCLIAGLIGLLLLIVACVGGAYYVTTQAKQLVVSGVRFVVVQGIEQSELTAEDKKQVIAEVDRLVDAYRKGEINEKDAENILNELQESPLIPLFVCFGIEKQYLDKSGLSAEEKADARKQLQRLVRGGMDKKIDQEDLDELLAPLQQDGPKGEKQIKPTLTDEEIKTFIAGAKELADEAEVPDEEFKIDIGDEVKKIVDRGLAKGKK